MREGAMDFEKIFAEQKEASGAETSKELMKTPEVVIESEKGISLMSFMLKGYDPEWGDNDHELSKATNEYFKKNPLSDKTVKALDDLKALEKDGIDYEVLFNISLSYQNPERFKETSENLTRDEEIAEPNKLQQTLLGLMEDLDKELNSNFEFLELKNKFDGEIKKDVEARNERFEMSKKELDKVMGFFRPKAGTTKAKKVNIMPTNFLYKKDWGLGFTLGDEILVMTSLDDLKSKQWTHEFLHSVINPIDAKLFKKLSETQKDKIIQLAQKDQKNRYNGSASALLNEAFIRSYVNYFEKNPFLSYEDSRLKATKEYVDSHREKFHDLFKKDVNFREKLRSIGILTIEEYFNEENIEKYFKNYTKGDDKLGNFTYDFLKDFLENKKKNEKTDI